MVGDTEDVTDLREAQRIIAALRRQVAHLQAVVVDLEAQCEPVAGEFTAFLDNEHTDMLMLLYRQGKLFEGQGDECELIDAFSEFVAGSIDVQWDMVRLEQEDARHPLGGITPSA
jgi:hypothetical protein